MKKVIEFLKAKIIFAKPKRKEILFFDGLNYHLFKRYFTSVQCEVLDTRKKKINIYVIIRLFLKFKKINGINYFFEYINIVNPKLIVSFTDNHNFLYKIKNKYPQIKVLSVQNGMRDQVFFDEITSKDFKADLILTWGNNISKEYSKKIVTKTITIGSFKNNLIKKSSDTKKENNIAFISTGYEVKNNYNQISNKNLVNDNQFYKPERLILPILLRVAKELKLNLEILGRSTINKNAEKEYYEKLIGKKEFNFFPHGEQTCYERSDIAKISFNIYSAFGLEVIARGNRCCFLNVRGKFVNEETMSCFWPGNFEKKGVFWSDEISYEEIRRIIVYSLKSDNDTWKKSVNEIYPNLIYFDENNKIFQKEIKNLLD